MATQRHAEKAKERNRNRPTLIEAVQSEEDYDIDDLIDSAKKEGSNFNINEQDKKNGDTALHICAGKGKYWQVKSLMKAGADAKVQNNFSDTPLHAVVRRIADSNEVSNFSDMSG